MIVLEHWDFRASHLAFQAFDAEIVCCDRLVLERMRSFTRPFAARLFAYILPLYLPAIV